MERYSETKLKKKQKPPRYAFIDVLRGICLVSMIAYHTMWDCVYIFGVNAPWFKTEYARIWQQSICWTFIFFQDFVLISVEITSKEFCSSSAAVS